MSILLQPGTTFFVPSGPEGYHLFVIVFGPVMLPNYGPNDQFVTVPICTAIPGVKHECPVPVGCHPFVKHDSYADFSYAEIRSRIDLEQHTKSTLFRIHDSMIDQATLQKIAEALPNSRRLRRFIKKDFFGWP